MGSHMLNEEKFIWDIMMKILERRRVKNDEAAVKLLLAWLCKQGHAADATTAFCTQLWEDAGKMLFDAAAKGDSTATFSLTAWSLSRRLMEP